jgi:branched-chain amino acid transport system substrate-binding protein
MDRRQFLQSTAAGLAAAGTGLQPMRAMAQGEPIRIGLMAPLTGVIASGGKEILV